MTDIRTSNGYYREVRRFGRVVERLYCGDSDQGWVALTGEPEQQDIEDEIREALDANDRETRYDSRVVA